MIVPVSKFINGREQQAELYEEGANILSVIRTKVSLHIPRNPLAIITLLTRNKVQAINENPEEINSPISYPIPEDYKKLVLVSTQQTIPQISSTNPTSKQLAIRTVTMIAQERTLDNGSFSDSELSPTPF